jgi:hypothetical protein
MWIVNIKDNLNYNIFVFRNIIMTQRYLQPNNNDTQWFLRANTIIGNSNENLNINLQSDNSLNKVIFKIGNNTTDFGSQYLKIPQGSTNQRPTTNLYSGYLRFNTTIDVLEYFSSTTNSWNSISVPPSIISVSPTFIDINDPSFVIIGSNFGPNPKVEAIGSDSTSFEMASVSVNGTNTIISTTLTGTNVIDNSNLEPFNIKVTNTSGLSAIFDNAFDINDSPIFTSFGGQTINTIINISGGFDVTGSGLLDISAVDNDPEHTISFTSSNLQSSGGSLVIDSNTGKISGITPSLSVTTNVTFSVSANDGFSTSTQTFTYKILVPQELSFSITSSDSPIISTLYVDSGGQPTGNGSPDLDGYTIYSIKTSDTIAPGQTTTGNFTSNVNINNLSFILVGGGGGGGSGNSGSALSAGGGGGGGLVVGTNQSLTSGQAYDFQVGKGGLGTKGPAFGSSFNSRLVYGQTDVVDAFNPITSGTYIARNGEDSFINVVSGQYTGNGGGFAGTRNYPFLASEGVATDASGIRGSGGIGGSGGGCGSTSVDQSGDGGPAKPGTSNQNTYGGTANITGYGNRGGQFVTNTDWFATGGGGAGETGQDAERAQVNGADTSYGTDGGDGVGVSNSILTTTTATQLGIGEIANNLVYFAGGGGAGGMDSFNGTGVNEANPNGGLGRPGGLGGGGDGRGFTQSSGNFVAPGIPPETSQSNYGNGNPGINGTGGGGGGTSAFNDSYAESWVSGTYGGTLNEAITSYWNTKSTSNLPILNSGGDGGSGVLLIKIASYKTI